MTARTAPRRVIVTSTPDPEDKVLEAGNSLNHFKLFLGDSVLSKIKTRTN